MKTTESFVHKNLRAVAQASVRKEASEPVSYTHLTLPTKA